MDRTLRCAGIGPGRGHTLWAGWVSRVSHSPLSVRTSFSRTRTRYRTRTGGPSSVIRCRLVAFLVGANCGGFHRSQSEHAVGQLGCMPALWYCRFSCNPIQRVHGSPIAAVGARALWCWTCRHSQVLTTRSACSHAVQQCSSEVAINGGRRDFYPPCQTVCREAEGSWVLSVKSCLLAFGGQGLEQWRIWVLIRSAKTE